MSVVQHDRARRSLCERLKPYSLPAGHDACQEGDDCDTLWMLTEGMSIPHPQINNPMAYFIAWELCSFHRLFCMSGVFTHNCSEADVPQGCCLLPGQCKWTSQGGSSSATQYVFIPFIMNMRKSKKKSFSVSASHWEPPKAPAWSY